MEAIMLKKLLLILALVVSLVCAGCPGDGSSSNKNAQRDFYIESHEISTIWRTCYGLDEPHDNGGEPDEIQKPVLEDEVYKLQPGVGYNLIVDYFNDHTNTKWIAFEIFVDGERYISSGSVINPAKKAYLETEEGGKASIVLFDVVPYNLQGRDISIDVWMEDEEGVKSEVYTFDVAVLTLWHTN